MKLKQLLIERSSECLEPFSREHAGNEDLICIATLSRRSVLGHRLRRVSGLEL